MKRNFKLAMFTTMLSAVLLISVCSGLLINVSANSPETYDDWPMFHHDLGHTGTTTSTAPNTNQTLWTYKTGGFVYSSPAVFGGRVYVGSHDHNVYCLNATTGVKIWSYKTGGIVWSSPAVFGGRVYVGSYDYKVYCLNATTGSFLWSYTTGDAVWSSPAVFGGRVYVGSYDYKVYCLNATTGSFLWSYTTDSYVLSSPAVADGKVYVVSGDEVYCLNASTGSFLWSYTTGGLMMYSSPAVSGGRVYIGSLDNKVYCLNASTGSFIWSYTTGNAVRSSPAVSGGRVYIGSEDYAVYCLNATTGVKIWSYKTGEHVYSSPAVFGGRVYIGSRDGKVYAFGPAAAPSYSLNLRIKDWGGNVLPSATVTVPGVGIATSNTNGWANFTLPPGTYTITVRWQGIEVNQTVIALSTSDVTMDVKCHVYDLTIRAVDFLHIGVPSLPIGPTTDLYIHHPNGTLIKARTDHTGRITITQLPIGDYKVEASFLIPFVKHTMIISLTSSRTEEARMLLSYPTIGIIAILLIVIITIIVKRRKS